MAIIKSATDAHGNMSVEVWHNDRVFDRATIYQTGPQTFDIAYSVYGVWGSARSIKSAIATAVRVMSEPIADKEV
jgi:hypothetical protein